MNIFLDSLVKLSPALAKSPTQLMTAGTPDYVEFCQDLTENMIRCDRDPRQAVAAYIRMSMEYLVLQSQLEKSGHYTYASFDEVNQHVYSNPDVMLDYYLDGLLLSQMWWPNHYRICRFFEESFLDKLPRSDLKAVEIGPGHGLHTGLFVRRCARWRLTSCDISEHSIAYAADWMRHFCGDAADQATFVKVDADSPFGPGADTYDALICGEVLEHLEQPGDFLREVARRLKTDGLAFLTAAIYAASIDHIYLFHSVDEVRALVQAAGLAIVDDIVLPVHPKDSPTARDAPINYAFTAKIAS